MLGKVFIITIVCSIVAAALALTTKERKLFLTLHNKLRSKLAKGQAINRDGRPIPSAKNMYRLTWSKKLENSAQRWADNCVFKHSNHDDPYGESLYYTTMEKGGAAIKDGLNSWWNELKEFGISGPVFTKQMKSSFILHFTQMAWAKTIKLGCGITYCPSVPMTLIVCHYSPRGNWDPVIYEAGHPCTQDSECTTYKGSKCNVAKGLCKAPSKAQPQRNDDDNRTNKWKQSNNAARRYPTQNSPNRRPWSGLTRW